MGEAEAEVDVDRLAGNKLVVGKANRKIFDPLRLLCGGGYRLVEVVFAQFKCELVLIQIGELAEPFGVQLVEQEAAISCECVEAEILKLLAIGVAPAANINLVDAPKTCFITGIQWNGDLVVGQAFCSPGINALNACAAADSVSIAKDEGFGFCATGAYQLNNAFELFTKAIEGAAFLVEGVESCWFIGRTAQI